MKYMKLLFLLIILLTTCPVAEAGPGNSGTDDVQYIKEQAESGDPEAQLALALMLDQGDRVKQDKQQAINWYTRAAEQNLPGACLFLGMKYENGNTVRQDSRLAVKWYTKAAMQGWPSAQYFLGMLYLRGGEIPENKVQAFTWLSLAAEHDYPGSDEEINRIQPLLSATEIEEARKSILKKTQAMVDGKSMEQ